MWCSVLVAVGFAAPNALADSAGRITEFSSGLNAKSSAVYIALGADGSPSSTDHGKGGSLTCARRPGSTLRRAGDVRIYRHNGQEYGCVGGGRRTVPITGRIEQVAGVSVLLGQTSEDNQYAYVASDDVVNLRTGRQYRVSFVDEPLGAPWSLTPGLIENVVLGADGDTARLYETPAPTGAPSSPPPTIETLDVVGHGRLVLATGAPGSIDPTSVTFTDGVVAWTQDGISHSAPA